MNHARSGPSSRGIAIPIPRARLEGDLDTPSPATGIVVFVHGSGSSRKSVRNRAVAARLRQAGLATLLLDLLTPEEEAIDRLQGRFRFDVALLGERVVAATEWVRSQELLERVPIGYFGASTGAAAALLAAAALGKEVGAVVSRGGRPDLAGVALPRVHAPTLLIVGAADTEVLELNRAAFDRLRCEKELRIVSGATHLFEEPGALEEVARLAASWFRRHLGTPEWAPKPADRLDASVRGE